MNELCTMIYIIAQLVACLDGYSSLMSSITGPYPAAVQYHSLAAERPIVETRHKKYPDTRKSKKKFTRSGIWWCELVDQPGAGGV